MPTGINLDALPLWGVFITTVGLVLASIAGGIRLGTYHKNRWKEDDGGPIGNLIGAILGLLAFVLAFTFGIAASRFDSRKELLLKEVNALSIIYSVTELLEEPDRSQIKTLLREYVDLRARESFDAQNLEDILKRSEEIHQELWSKTVSLTKGKEGSEIIALYIEALNEVIQLHNSRVTVGLRARIPRVIWQGLYFIAALAMIAVGFQFGMAGRWSWIVISVLALSFSTVLLLTADLDRAAEGALKVSQQPMIELQRKLAR